MADQITSHIASRHVAYVPVALSPGRFAPSLYDAASFPGRVALIPVEMAMKQALFLKPTEPDVHVVPINMDQLANAVCWAATVRFTGSAPPPVQAGLPDPYLWIRPHWGRVADQLAELSPHLKPGPMLQVVNDGLAAGAGVGDDSMYRHVRSAMQAPRWQRLYQDAQKHIGVQLGKASDFLRATLHGNGARSIWACDLAAGSDAQLDLSSTDTLQQLTGWRKKLLNNMRSRSIFRDLRGMSWHLRYSAAKGTYLTVVGIAACGQARAHAQRDSLARYWIETITEGEGAAFRPNPQVLASQPCVAEVFSRSASQQRLLVRTYFSYLLTSPEFVQLDLPEKTPQLAWNYGKGTS